MNRYLTKILAVALLAVSSCGGSSNEASGEGTQKSNSATSASPQAEEINETEDEPILGKWEFTTVTNKDVAYLVEAEIDFTSDERFTGNTGCNEMSGTYKVKELEISLEVAEITEMTCHESHENSFLLKLNQITNYKITDRGLVLYTDFYESPDGGHQNRDSIS